MLLSELTASARRLALVGLAKNTGKTEALGALLRELAGAGRRVGVTSVGRDGEERDAIDHRIEKPRVRLPGGSLVATTDGLLRASGLPHELLERTEMRTPLGRVVVARMRGPGTIEVAGPSAAAGVRAVCEAMLAHGAEQALIDGAIDRRAASSPSVADALVMSTGAVLDEELEHVVTKTVEAAELVRLERVGDARVRELAGGEDDLALDADALAPLALPERFALTSDGEAIARMLDAHPQARWLTFSGALPERFLHALAHAARKRRRELIVVVGDPTKVFLSTHGPRWYAAHGVRLEVLRPIDLRAITVNPLAPQSHRFDSRRMRELLAAAIPDVAVFDVLHADYPGAREPAAAL